MQYQISSGDVALDGVKAGILLRQRKSSTRGHVRGEVDIHMNDRTLLEELTLTLCGKKGTLLFNPKKTAEGEPTYSGFAMPIMIDVERGRQMDCPDKRNTNPRIQ